VANRDIKLYAAGKGIRQWQVAKAFGYTPEHFSTLLRTEWQDDKKAEFRAKVDELAPAQEGA